MRAGALLEMRRDAMAGWMDRSSAERERVQNRCKLEDLGCEF